VAEIDRRRFLMTLGAFGGLVAGGSLLDGCVSPIAAPNMDWARHTLMGLWDAVVPGTFNGVVEDPGPGATDAGVQEWMEAAAGTLPAPLDYITDWFLRAWANDLDLWAEVFHFSPNGGEPTFGELPLGPTLLESGRQYKIMLMMGLFDGIIELQYFGAIALAKLAFYCDYRAHTAGTPPVGGPYIGFPGAVGSSPNAHHTYNLPAGTGDPRLSATPDGLVMVP
jgi:hypothetical protein